MSPLLAAALIVFLEGLGFGFGLPVLSAYTRELGGGVEVGGWMFALSTLPRIVCGPMWGRISDHIGRRWALAIITAGTTAASLLWALCPTLHGTTFTALTWLILSRALYGVFASQSVLSLAVASDVSAPEKRASAMGIVGAAFGVAFTLGPFLGGMAAKHWGMQTIGYLSAGSQILSLGCIFFLLRETHPHHTAADNKDSIFVAPTAILALAMAPRTISLMIVTCLSTIAYSIMLPTYEPMARLLLNWGPAEVGPALGVFGLVGAFVQGGIFRPLVKKYGERVTAILGLIILAAGLIWVGLLPSTGGFWAATILMALGTGLCTPAAATLMSRAVGEYDQGAIHGLNYSATSLGRGSGYLIGSYLFGYISPAAAYFIAGAFSLSAIVVLMRPRKTRM